MIEEPAARYRCHRFLPEIVAHALWLYCRFPLSLREVEDLLAERGIDVSFQTVSEWVVKFGLKFAYHPRRRSRGNFADKWHLDELVVSIMGRKCWLWRAVDAEGYVLDALLQSRRNKKAALRLMRKLLKSQGVTPRLMVTDKLRSYGVAKAELIPGVEHRSHKGLNSRAENSHLPLRRRERRMMRFKSARQCQHFVSVHGQITNLFHLHRKHLTAADHRQLRASAVTTWREIALSTVLRNSGPVPCRTCHPLTRRHPSRDADPARGRCRAAFCRLLGDRMLTDRKVIFYGSHTGR